MSSQSKKRNTGDAKIRKRFVKLGQQQKLAHLALCCKKRHARLHGLEEQQFNADVEESRWPVSSGCTYNVRVYAFWGA